MLNFRDTGEKPNRTDDVLDRLMAQLHQRVAQLPESSYSTSLLRAGDPALFAKLREECEELIEASGESGEDQKVHLVHEACDLVFHTWLLLAKYGVDVDDLRRELERREGVSGLEEKRNRTKGSD